LNFLTKLIHVAATKNFPCKMAQIGLHFAGGSSEGF